MSNRGSTSECGTYGAIDLDARSRPSHFEFQKYPLPELRLGSIPGRGVLRHLDGRSTHIFRARIRAGEIRRMRDGRGNKKEAEG